MSKTVKLDWDKTKEIALNKGAVSNRFKFLKYDN